MKKLIIDNDIQTLNQSLNDNKNKTIFLLFTGSKDQSGISWCPDCVVAEPVIHEVFDDQSFASDDYLLITIYTGQRDIWKDPQNVWRNDKDLRVKCVPTLINWSNKNRLEEEQLFDKELVKMLSED